MILAVDSSALALLINPSANPPIDPNTGAPVDRARERVEHFIAQLSSVDTVIIPTPVLAEVLVRAEQSAPDVLRALSGFARMKVRAFDERAAVETAFMTQEAIANGDKKSGSTDAWQKVKVDRQIIAVARVQGATRIYSDDQGLTQFAKRLGMDVCSTWELPNPPATQLSFLEEPRA